MLEYKIYFKNCNFIENFLNKNQENQNAFNPQIKEKGKVGWLLWFLFHGDKLNRKSMT